MSAKTTAIGALAGEGASSQKVHGGKKVGYFVKHWLEMCAAMCVGSAIGTALYVWAMGLLGYPDPLKQLPELTTLVSAFDMTVAMVGWMRFRGMAWRPINEMSAVMVVEAVVLIGAYWLGFVGGDALFGLYHGLMMPAMLVPMFLRLDFYTGKCH